MASDDRLEGEDVEGSPRPEGKPSRLRRFLAKAWRLTPAILIGLCAFAAILRLSLRDLIPAFALLFYATPPPVLAVVALAAGGLWARRRKWRQAGAGVLVAVACVVWWDQTAWFANDPLPTESTLRVLFWNVDRGNAGFERVADAVREVDADVIGLVEADAYKGETGPLWKRRFPNYEVCGPYKGILFMVRGGAVHEIVTTKLGGGYYRGFLASLSGKPRRFVVVDIKSYLFRARNRPLMRLTRDMMRHANEPLIVMGDFNLPLESALLGPLRRFLHNTFETRGRGSSGTWPAWLGLLSLDQVWVTPFVQVRKCEIARSPLSDHRMVIVEIAR